MSKEEIVIGTKVLVSHEDEILCNELASMLSSLGYDIAGKSFSKAGLKELADKEDAELIVTGIHYADGMIVEVLLEIAEDEPVPTIIIAKQVDLDDVEKALEDHVMGYLIDPVDQRDLETTCYLVLRRFQQFKELRGENKELKDTLVARKKIERAKGILMEKYQITEEDAYLRLRNAATKQRIKMTEVADIIIDSLV